LAADEHHGGSTIPLTQLRQPGFAAEATPEFIGAVQTTSASSGTCSEAVSQSSSVMIVSSTALSEPQATVLTAEKRTCCLLCGFIAKTAAGLEKHRGSKQCKKREQQHQRTQSSAAPTSDAEEPSGKNYNDFARTMSCSDGFPKLRVPPLQKL